MHNKETFDEVYNRICEIVEDYGDEFMKNNDVDYSTMTKNREVEALLVDRLYNSKIKEANRNNWIHLLKYWKK